MSHQEHAQCAKNFELDERGLVREKRQNYIQAATINKFRFVHSCSHQKTKNNNSLSVGVMTRSIKVEIE